MSAENPKTAGIVPISQAVYEVCNDLGDYRLREYPRFLQWAIRAYIDLNMYHSERVEVAYKKMDANGIVDMSVQADFIDYVKVGYPMQGKLITLGVNDKIMLRRDEIPEDVAVGIFNGEEDVSVLGDYGHSYFAPHYYNGSLVGGLYGLSGGAKRSYYRFDYEKSQFQFDTSLSNNDVVIEYISTGVSPTGNTLIKRQAVPVLIAYIHWQRVEFDPRVPMNEKMRRERAFDAEVEKMRFFENAPTIQEILNEYYKTVFQTVKR